MQEYILVFIHCHMDSQLAVAVAYELEFQMRPPLHSGLKPWEAPGENNYSSLSSRSSLLPLIFLVRAENDPDAVVSITPALEQDPKQEP